MTPRERFRASPPRLIVITDLAVAPLSVLEPRIERLLAAARPGSVWVQLRDRELPVRERLALGERLLPACRAHEGGLLVNDRLDLAVLVGADGVHLGEGSVSVEDARAAAGEAAVVTRAAHDPALPREAGGDEADAVLLSPIVAARKGRAPLGVAGIRDARAALDGTSARATALYALGGVDESSAAAVLRAGASGVAVIGAALDGRPPEPLLAALGIRR